MGYVAALRHAAAAMLLPATVAGAAVAFHIAEGRTAFSVVRTGLLDEPAHLAFAGLALWVLCLLVHLPRRFYSAALVASVAIDVDHVPLYLGVDSFAVQPHGRPFTHSLATIALLLLIAALWRRQKMVFLGAATGVFLHLVRDLVEGAPGVALLWPLSDRELSVTGAATFVVLVVGLLLARFVLLAHGARVTHTPGISSDDLDGSDLHTPGGPRGQTSR